MKNISEIDNRKKPLFSSQYNHSYKYDEPKAFTLGIQKLINFSMKKFIDPLALNAVIKDKKGREALNPHLLRPLKWIYTSIVIIIFVITTIVKIIIHIPMLTVKINKYYRH